MKFRIDRSRCAKLGLDPDSPRWDGIVDAALNASRETPPAAKGKEVPSMLGFRFLWLLHVGIIPTGMDDPELRRSLIRGLADTFVTFVEKHIDVYERVRTGPKSSERVFLKGYLNWYDTYREALLLALIVADEAGLDRLLGWLDDQVVFSDGAWRASEEDNLFYKLLAKGLREGASIDADGRVERVSSGRGVHAKLKLLTWRAIEAGDAQGATKGIKKLVEYHRKKFESYRRQTHTAVGTAIDASILYHLARRRGLNVPVGEGEMLYVMTMESLTGGGVNGEGRATDRVGGGEPERETVTVEEVEEDVNRRARIEAESEEEMGLAEAAIKALWAAEIGEDGEAAGAGLDAGLAEGRGSELEEEEDTRQAMREMVEAVDAVARRVLAGEYVEPDVSRVKELVRFYVEIVERRREPLLVVTAAMKEVRGLG